MHTPRRGIWYASVTRNPRDACGIRGRDTESLEDSMLPDFTPSEQAKVWDRLAPADENGCRDCTSRANPGSYGRIRLRGQSYSVHRLVFLLSGGALTPERPLVCHRCNRPWCCEPTHLYAGSHSENARYMGETGRHSSQTHPERVPRGDRHWSRREPERIARGDKNGARVHPERVARGDRHGSRTHPERVPRGDRHPSRLHPERLPHGDRHWTRRLGELVRRGERVGTAKLTEALVIYLRVRYAAGDVSQTALAREVGVSRRTVGMVISRLTWKHV